MLLLSDQNSEQFLELLDKTSKNYKVMMDYQHEEFDLKWKKQITYFMLASYAFYQAKKPPNMMLSCIFSAQRITSSIDRDVPRNLDYILAVNTLTALILTKIGRSDEALEFILAAEKHLAVLIEMNIEGAPHPKMVQYLERKHAAQEQYVDIQRKKKGGKITTNRMSKTIKVEIFDASGPGNEIRNLKTRQCTTRREQAFSDNDGGPYLNKERAIFS